MRAIKIQIIIFLLSLTNICSAANIFVSTPSTVVIEGVIVKRDFERFLQAVSEVEATGHSVSLVETRDSIGGSTYQGMLIGFWIMEHQIDTIAVGECGSTCANHIFLAGKRKQIKNGFIAFHGSPISTEKLFPERSRSFNNSEIKEAYHDSLADAQQQRMWVSQNQNEFYEQLDIDHEFFFASGSARNLESIGCRPGDQMWVPTIEQMQQYGVQDIFGEIDKNGALKYCYNPDFYRTTANDYSMGLIVVDEEKRRELLRSIEEVELNRQRPLELRDLILAPIKRDSLFKELDE